VPWPIACAGVDFPYLVVVPYWKRTVVACPLAVTTPFSVAPRGPMLFAGAVVADGGVGAAYAGAARTTSDKSNAGTRRLIEPPSWTVAPTKPRDRA
jgi:hypothetical protein